MKEQRSRDVRQPNELGSDGSCYWDLSHPVWEGMPIVPGQPGVQFRTVTTIGEDAHMNTCEFGMSTHVGTHVDAPSHAMLGAPTIDQIHHSRFVGWCVVGGVNKGLGEVIAPADLSPVEPNLLAGDWVLVYTGMDVSYGSPDYFDYPSFDPEIGAWAKERQIQGLGVDTLSPDAPMHRRSNMGDVPVHRELLGNDVLLIENLRGLSDLVGQRVRIAIGVLALRGLDGSPARVIAWRDP